MITFKTKAKRNQSFSILRVSLKKLFIPKINQKIRPTSMKSNLFTTLPIALTCTIEGKLI